MASIRACPGHTGYFAQVEERRKMDRVRWWHVARTGTHADVAVQAEFNRDIRQAADLSTPGELVPVLAPGGAARLIGHPAHAPGVSVRRIRPGVRPLAPRSREGVAIPRQHAPGTALKLARSLEIPDPEALSREALIDGTTRRRPAPVLPTGIRPYQDRGPGSIKSSGGCRGLRAASGRR